MIHLIRSAGKQRSKDERQSSDLTLSCGQIPSFCRGYL